MRNRLLVILQLVVWLGCSEEDECGPEYLAKCEDDTHITVCARSSSSDDDFTLRWYTSDCATHYSDLQPNCVSTQGTAVCSSSTTPDPSCVETLQISSYCAADNSFQFCQYGYPTGTFSCAASDLYCVQVTADNADCSTEPSSQGL